MTKVKAVARTYFRRKLESVEEVAASPKKDKPPSPRISTQLLQSIFDAVKNHRGAFLRGNQLYFLFEMSDNGVRSDGDLL